MACERPPQPIFRGDVLRLLLLWQSHKQGAVPGLHTSHLQALQGGVMNTRSQEKRASLSTIGYPHMAGIRLAVAHRDCMLIEAFGHTVFVHRGTTGAVMLGGWLNGEAWHRYSLACGTPAAAFALARAVGIREVRP